MSDFSVCGHILYNTYHTARKCTLKTDPRVLDFQYFS